MNCAFCNEPVLPEQMVKIGDAVFHWDCFPRAARQRGCNEQAQDPTRHPRLFTMRSILSDKIHEMVIWMTDAQFAEVCDSTNRRVIQEVLPEASAEEREFLISGMSPQEQHNFFDDREE